MSHSMYRLLWKDGKLISHNIITYKTEAPAIAKRLEQNKGLREPSYCDASQLEKILIDAGYQVEAVPEKEEELTGSEPKQVIEEVVEVKNVPENPEPKNQKKKRNRKPRSIKQIEEEKK